MIKITTCVLRYPTAQFGPVRSTWSYNALMDGSLQDVGAWMQRLLPSAWSVAEIDSLATLALIGRTGIAVAGLIYQWKTLSG